MSIPTFPTPHMDIPLDGYPTSGALLSLNLDDNELKLGGCKAICEALKSNSTVTSLSMCKNTFQSKSAAAIADMLRTNGALASLDLSSNHIADDQKINLRKICDSKSINLKL